MGCSTTTKDISSTPCYFKDAIVKSTKAVVTTVTVGILFFSKFGWSYRTPRPHGTYLQGPNLRLWLTVTSLCFSPKRLRDVARRQLMGDPNPRLIFQHRTHLDNFKPALIFRFLTSLPIFCDFLTYYPFFLYITLILKRVLIILMLFF